MHIRSITSYAAVIMVLVGACVVPDHAWAHCDSLEGPVVEDARLALEKGDPTPAFLFSTSQNLAASLIGKQSGANSWLLEKSARFGATR